MALVGRAVEHRLLEAVREERTARMVLGSGLEVRDRAGVAPGRREEEGGELKNQPMSFGAFLFWQSMEKVRIHVWIMCGRYVEYIDF